VGFESMEGCGGSRFIQAVRLILPVLSILLATGSLVTVPIVVKSQAGRDGPSSDFYHPQGVEQQNRHILLRKFNEARQREMVSDSEKLVQLAGELDAEVRAASGSPLSAEQLSKIERIQKLAHSVKDKMQFAVLPY
jgi:hypothetical protein